MQEHNPKKSKALIITFVLILLLLIAGYYLFKNRGQIFGTNGSSLSKIFSPLLGTSKPKDLTVIGDGTGTKTPTNTAPKRTATIVTDANGNKMILAEAGEDLKKGDVLYVSGFNTAGNPIVKKAIANDPTKALVFGVAEEDMKVGKLGNIIIEGILSSVPTNRKEGTLWVAKNPLYLSDVIYGGMTKNPPVSPSLTVPVGSVIKVDPINGSIRIGNLANNPDINNTQTSNLDKLNGGLLAQLTPDMRDYWNSAFANNTYDTNGFDQNGYDRNGYNANGYDTNGYNASGYDANGYNASGYDANGYDRNGYTVSGYGANGNSNNGNPPLIPITPPSDIVTPSTPTTPSVPNINGTTCTDAKATNYNQVGTCTYTTANICMDIEQNPLTFTPEEKARLDILLRKFYLISSTLRTSDDITTIYNEIDQQNNFIGQIKDLTNQCNIQVTPAMMTTNNWVRHGNPWFTKTSGGTFPYTSDNNGYTDFSWIQGPDGPGCTAVSGYYYGGSTTQSVTTGPISISVGTNCDEFNGSAGYNSCNFGDVSLKIRDGYLPDENVLKAGCKWHDGVDFGSTERILNIW